MKKLLALLFSLCASLIAFDSVEVLNPNITLHKHGYFRTDKTLTPEEAFAFAKAGNLKELPKQAMCSGFGNDTYWFLFELGINADEPIFLNPRGTSIFYQDLFVFKDEKLIKAHKNGFFVPIEQRDVKIFPVRFKLEQNSKNTTYLLKLESTTPKYLSFSFGTTCELNKSWIVTYIIIVSASVIAFSFIIYNFFIYLFTKDKAYFYYCFYMAGLLFANYVSFGHQLLLLGVDGKYVDKLIPFAATICMLGLTFFTIHFLDMRQKYTRFKQLLMILNGILVVLGPLYVFGIAKPIFLGVIQIIALLTIAIGVKRYFDGYRPARYYLLATGIAMVMTTIWSMMLSGKIVPLTLLSANLANLAIIWDTILLSLALAYRIKLLQEEKEQAQKLIAKKAKFTTIGETLGNIAHQWRQPLAQLSSINTSLDFGLKFNGKIENEKLQESLESSNQIIKHLSGTVETFQNFFVKHDGGSFDASECVDNVLSFMEGGLEQNSIKVNFSTDGKAIVNGSKDEFFQTLLVLLNNAKDAIVENKTPNPIIDIKLISSTESITLTIEDNGGGIKLKNINEIFEPYASTKGVNGMGIGLYMLKMIVEERMGGTITVENTREGAMFVLTLNIVRTSK